VEAWSLAEDPESGEDFRCCFFFWGFFLGFAGLLEGALFLIFLGAVFLGLLLVVLGPAESSLDEEGEESLLAFTFLLALLATFLPDFLWKRFQRASDSDLPVLALAAEALLCLLAAEPTDVDRRVGFFFCGKLLIFSTTGRDFLLATPSDDEESPDESSVFFTGINSLLAPSKVGGLGTLLTSFFIFLGLDTDLRRTFLLFPSSDEEEVSLEEDPDESCFFCPGSIQRLLTVSPAVFLALAARLRARLARLARFLTGDFSDELEDSSDDSSDEDESSDDDDELSDEVDDSSDDEIAFFLLALLAVINLDQKL
jgi:hypothetical protein